MKKVLIFLTLCMGHAVSVAQDGGGKIYFQPQFQSLSLSNINAKLAESGFEAATASFGSGAGGYGYFGRFIFGGEGNYFSSIASNSASSTELNGGWGNFYFGYNLLAKSKGALYPSVGVGYGGATITAIRKVNQPTVNDILSNGNAATLAIGSAFLHTAVTYEWQINDSIGLGVKTAYNFTFGERDWRVYDAPINLTDRFGGLAVSAIVSFRLR